MKRIKNWNKFNESIFMIEDSFLVVLNAMKSRLAPIIRDMRGSDIELVYNFLNLSSDEKFPSGGGFISFILDKKIGGLKGTVMSDVRPSYLIDDYDNDVTPPIPKADLERMELYNSLHHGQSVNIVSLHKMRDRWNFYLVEIGGGKLLPVLTSGVKIEGNKSSISIGKAIRSILKLNGIQFTDKELEEFLNEFKSLVNEKDSLDKFEIVSGEDIRKWYLTDNNDNSVNGTLQGSCMNGYSQQDYLDIYVKNDDIVRLLILKSLTGDKIVGRALLWELTDGRIFMDRIYTSEKYQEQIFKNYAIQRGWLYRVQQSALNTDIVTSDGLDVGRINVQLDRSEFSYYPYMDTLKWINTGSDKLSNIKISGYDGPLESTEGNFGDVCDNCGGDQRVECYECGGMGEVECGECGGMGEVEEWKHCEECDGRGTIYNEESDERDECSNCGGEGGTYEVDECPECGGRGAVECDVCGGDGMLYCPEC